ncbi:hypothetical protein LOAG_15566, partial [Loa loa]
GETLLSYILIATVLKLISLLHCSAHLILTKTFFIDWERPHITFKTNNKTPITSDIKEDVEITQPVIWYDIIYSSYSIPMISEV